MKKKFPGYYRRDENQLNEMWNNCIFVVDANVLLNLYRYSADTCQKLLDVFKYYHDRLFVPHQAAYEYHKNRLIVISKQMSAYDEVRDVLKKFQRDLVGQLNSYNRHPLIEADGICNEVNNLLLRIDNQLINQKEQHPNLFEADYVLKNITEIFEDKVGDPFSADDLHKIYKEGEDRYQKSQPPGYIDAKNKTGNEKFGDLILWYQVIEFAKAKGKSIILITDDSKEDWWWKFQGKTVGPRPELIEEIRNKATVDFHMYKPDQFLLHAGQKLRQQVDEVAVEEIREVSKKNLNTLAVLGQLVDAEDNLAAQFQVLLRKRKKVVSAIEVVSEKLNDVHGSIVHFDIGKSAKPEWLSETKRYFQELLERKSMLEKHLLELDSDISLIEQEKQKIVGERSNITKDVRLSDLI